jgi:hypothetical protein
MHLTWIVKIARFVDHFQVTPAVLAEVQQQICEDKCLPSEVRESLTYDKGKQIKHAYFKLYLII